MSNFDMTIDDIAEIFDGPHATPEKTNSGPYFLSISSLKKGRLDLSQSAFLSEIDFTRWTKRVTPQKGDILFSYETRLGEAALMPEGIRACLGRRMGILRPKKNKVIPEYLLYAYLSPKFQQTIISNTIRGATVDRISLNELPNFPIRIPSLIEQQNVSSILVALDSKIELNNRINAKLEAMAKTLFDYWFVQFDFPDKHGKPYKTNGGKMIWNDELMREIPEGWESLQLASKLLFEKGIEPGSAEYTDKKESIYHVNFIRVGDVDGSSAIFIDTRQKKYSMVSERDVLVTFDGSVGKVAFGLAGAYSGGLRKIFDKSGLIDNSLIYFIFKDERINRTIHKYATGSILLHAGGSINVLKIPYNEEKYLEYQNIILSSYNKMVMNKKENQKLTELRDWLLPMLMNGQVKVS